VLRHKTSRLTCPPLVFPTSLCVQGAIPLLSQDERGLLAHNSMNKKFLFGLLGCMLLTILFSACRIVDASTLPKNPKALMGASQFLTTDITVKKGQSLDLVDTVSNPHVIANGFYDASGKVTKPPESDAPQIGTISFNGSDAQTIGPFNAAGDFHYYCTIHPNMNLLVHVTA